MVVREWSFEAFPDDTLDPTNGPNGRGCGDGAVIDRVRFDGKFTCVCNATKFRGDNCGEEIPVGEQVDAGAVAGGLIAAFAVTLAVSVLLYKRRVRQIKLRAFDFRSKCEEMIQDGGLDLDMDINKLPREIKRGHVTMVAKIGAGAFGEVWKGMLDESSVGGVPGYLVAIKTSKEITGDGANELTKEATVMAQIDPHKHLVSLVGVVTSGPPLLLLLSFCEKGSLLAHVRKAEDASKPLGLKVKLAIADGIARGMAHLADSHLIHRDLAARNVLVDSAEVAKVADFGLSRIVANDVSDADGERDDSSCEEYYRSHGGAFAVRWTAPEAIETMKFSTASDIWSYGIVLLELFANGARPYGNDLNNPAVITLVLGGGRAKRPQSCPPKVYSLMLNCWAQEPRDRPSFHELVYRLAPLAVELTGAQAQSTGMGDGVATVADLQLLPDYALRSDRADKMTSMPQGLHEYTDTITTSIEYNVSKEQSEDEYADTTTASTEYNVARNTPVPAALPEARSVLVAREPAGAGCAKTVRGMSTDSFSI